MSHWTNVRIGLTHDRSEEHATIIALEPKDSKVRIPSGSEGELEITCTGNRIEADTNLRDFYPEDTQQVMIYLKYLLEHLDGAKGFLMIEDFNYVKVYDVNKDKITLMINHSR